MTNLTSEERAIRKQSIENISEIYVPISVIEGIKAEIKQEFDYVRVGCEVFEMGKAAGYRNAYNIIEKHIKEYKE